MGSRKEKKRKLHWLWDRAFWEDVLSVVFGILLCAAIGGVMMHPGSRPFLALLFVSGSGVNWFNGMKLYRNKKQRNMGMSMMLLGALILLIGFYVMFGRQAEVWTQAG